jgi:uncharacterized protein (TIGR02594 family)
LNRFLSGDTRGMTDAQYAWCSRFVKQAATEAGVDVSKATDMARSWLNVGTPTDKPQKGDVAVFSRGDPQGAFGHVGFYDSTNPDGSIRILAGNQGDAVSYGSMPSSRLLGYRRLDPAGAFATAANDVPPILQSNYGRQPAAPDASATVASAAPAPSASAPSLSSAFGKAAPTLGGLTSGAAALFGGSDDKAMQQARQANAQALNEEDQRQASALRQVLQKRLQEKQSAFGSIA